MTIYRNTGEIICDCELKLITEQRFGKKQRLETHSQKSAEKKAAIKGVSGNIHENSALKYVLKIETWKTILK